MAALLLLVGLPLVQAQSTSTFTSTTTAVQISTFIPTITVSQASSCGCNVTDLCANVLSTWDPTSSSTTSTIPIPSNLYTFTVSDSEAVDIDSNGNMILSDSSSGLTSAFTVNADGTLTAYGSNLNMFADFSDVIASRDLNTVYNVGFCFPGSGLSLRQHRRGTSFFFSRQTGKVYIQFSVTDGFLQLDSSGSTYNFVNCVGNSLGIYDVTSDSLPNTCGIVDLNASSVATASYSQYYSVGLSQKAQYTAVSTCDTSPTTSTSIITTAVSITLPESVGTDTNTAAEADFTSASDPYPVFAMSVYELGPVFLNDTFQIVAQSGNGSMFHGFQTTPDDGLTLIGADLIIYANTSVRVDNERSVCDTRPIFLTAASSNASIPDSSVTGPFITNPDVGLILMGYQFIACNGSQSLQVLAEQCDIPTSCYIVNPGLFLLDAISEQQALYNGALLYQRLFPPAPDPTPTVVTSMVIETDAVQFARDFLLEGGYSDFCSSELGYYTTSTVVELYPSTVATVTDATTETSVQTDYSSTVIVSVTTAATSVSTLTTTSSSTTTYTITSRSVILTASTVLSTTIVTTQTLIRTFYPFTATTSLATRKLVTTTPKRRDLGVYAKRTQAQNLTPSSLQPYDPSIVGLACSSFFQVFYDNFNKSAFSFTYLTDTTTTVETTYTTYTATNTTTSTTSTNALGTKTSYSYTSTVTSSYTPVNIDYSYRLLQTTTTATDIFVNLIKSYNSTTRIVTDGTTTTTVLNPATVTVCPPQITEGGVINTGAIQPFVNITSPEGFNTTSMNTYGYWDPLPAGYPNAPLVANIRGYIGSGQTVAIVNTWVRQKLKVCSNTVYYVQIVYKWYWNKLVPETVTNPGDGSGIVSYKNCGVRIAITGVDGYEINFSADAYFDVGTAVASKNAGSAGAQVLTGNFTTTSTGHTLWVGANWKNSNASQFIGSPYQTNRLYVYSMKISTDKF
ncbi:hypothetical protein ABW20_dc0109356 [Dactylellina cionopaga]|nr:hypothetical protein ABW20_dc0109356 [Dactylellina cionopaga]